MCRSIPPKYVPEKYVHETPETPETPEASDKSDEAEKVGLKLNKSKERVAKLSKKLGKALLEEERLREHYRSMLFDRWNAESELTKVSGD